MPNYLWKAKDGKGKRVALRRPAASVKESQLQLLQEGFTDLELQKDDIMEATTGLFEEQVEVTPEEDIEFQNAGSFSIWKTLLRSFTEHKQSTVVLLLVLAHGIYRERPWQSFLASACLVGWPLLSLWFSLPSYYYSRLNTAKVWGRWDEVLGCVAALRKIGNWSLVKIPDLELDRCTAQALAAQGNLAEGLKIFEKHARSSAVPEWMYYSQLSNIYDTAKDHEKGLECMEKSVELAPDNATLLLDLAFRLSKYHNRPADSRAILARVDLSVLIPYAKAYLPFLEGVILFRENRFGEAREELLKAVKTLGEFLHHELARSPWLLAKSYLCAAEQKLGSTNTVKKLWADVRRFLKVHREEELLALCEPLTAVLAR